MMYTAAALWVTRPVATKQRPAWTSLSRTPNYHSFLSLTCLLKFPEIPSGTRWEGSSSPLPSCHCSGTLWALPSPFSTILSLVRLNKQNTKVKLISRELRSLSSSTFNFSCIQLLLMSCLDSNSPIWCCLRVSCYLKPLNLFTCYFFSHSETSHSLVIQKIPTGTLKFCPMSLPGTVSSAILSIVWAFRTFRACFLCPSLRSLSFVCLQVCLLPDWACRGHEWQLTQLHLPSVWHMPVPFKYVRRERG